MSFYKCIFYSILVGSYNHSVQVWNTSGECLTTLPGHSGPVKAVSWISNEKNTETKFLSASHDQSILVWVWNKTTNKVDKAEKCIGHTESVECVDVNAKNLKVFMKKKTLIFNLILKV